MVQRIEITSKVEDGRAKALEKRLQLDDFPVDAVAVTDVYTVDGADDNLEVIGDVLANQVTQKVTVGTPLMPGSFDWAIEVGYLPGVTDNVASTAQQSIEDRLGVSPDTYSSQITFLSGDLTREQVEQIGETLGNPVIQRVSIKSCAEYGLEGMDLVVPKVRLTEHPTADIVDLLSASNDELAIIGKQGIANADGSRRGPLALGQENMHVIQDYFRSVGRNPTDIELECIAQTWSDHCTHLTFTSPMEGAQDGLYKRFIQKATNDIRRNLGEDDFCVSVFSDNSGAIIFDKNYLITDKAETHNSPSALDPFGGSITGIVGVNRDAMGFGLGAKPVINRYGFCFGDPTDKQRLYKGENFTQKMLSSRAIMDGVIEGVNIGGNCSGIPSPQGFAVFDKNYSGKPLVFVGTVGLIPRESAGRPSHLKQARPGDYSVMMGGRVGKDGIHGATFSSETMDSGSPATAVQIGDPITQKKMSDALIKEARDRGFYTSITDNGAGGLSCSIPEMAKESGGCHIYLDEVLLKYPGMSPWEILVSESQERMTLSVPPEKWEELSNLMTRHGVEATIVGEFTDSEKCVVDYHGETVMDLGMEFLHGGMLRSPLEIEPFQKKHEEPLFPEPKDLTESLHAMLARQNIASLEFISSQYDHEVQGGSVLKPLQGRGRVNANATVTKPVLDSPKGVAISQGINPRYSYIDTYDMAACAIDTAVRNLVAVGADPSKIALMDNFCWPSSSDPKSLWQLREAAKACYNTAIVYGTPFISGKDSMNNMFKGFDEEGNPKTVAVPPTLMVSSLSVMENATEAVSLDAKVGGDHVYVLGITFEELGGSEYFAMRGEEVGKKYIGNVCPEVSTARNKETYVQMHRAVTEGLVASAIGVDKGGLGVAFAKTAMGGRLGMDLILEANQCRSEESALFSESQGRLVVTVAPENCNLFERIIGKVAMYRAGTVRDDNKFIIRNTAEEEFINTDVDAMLKSYRSTFRDY